MSGTVVAVWCVAAALLAMPFHGLIYLPVYLGICGIGFALDCAFFPKRRR